MAGSTLTATYSGTIKVKSASGYAGSKPEKPEKPEKPVQPERIVQMSEKEKQIEKERKAVLQLLLEKT